MSPLAQHPLRLQVFFYNISDFEIVHSRDLNIAAGPTLDFRCYCCGAHMNVAVGAIFGQRVNVLSNYRLCANIARTETRLSRLS